jgi:DNA repair exonuclease SbcCD nuclease subunit
MDLRLLATADLHLGMRFAGYPEAQSNLAEARFTALERLVEQANVAGCRLFLIAGDLFERPNLPQREVLRAANMLAEFQGELAAVLPGNHDYFAGESGSLWKSFRERAGDRVLLLDRPQVYDLRHYGLEVLLYPGPCTSRHSPRHALDWIAPQERPDDGLLRIGLAHGSIEGFSPDLEGEYCPMRIPELEALGLDLWIVGHTHRPYPSAPSADSRLFIPGIPEPDGFDCRHEGSAWLISLTGDRRVRSEQLRTGTYRFRREELDLEPGSDPEQRLAALRTPEAARTLLRLTLKGFLASEQRSALRAELDKLSKELFRLEVDDGELSEWITQERVQAEFSQGSFPHELLTRLIAEGQPEALQLAYALIQEARR